MFTVVRFDGVVMAQFGSYERSYQYLEACVNPYEGLGFQPSAYKGTTQSDYHIELRQRMDVSKWKHQPDELVDD